MLDFLNNNILKSLIFFFLNAYNGLIQAEEGDEYLKNRNFVISEEDWSLHRKGFDDQKRHQDKIKEVLRKKLPEVISEENIIMSRGKEIIRIPIRSLDEYKIRYNSSNRKHVGQGDGQGNPNVGDVIGKDSSNQSDKASDKAGDQPGVDYYEAEVDFETIEEAFFSLV